MVSNIFAPIFIVLIWLSFPFQPDRISLRNASAAQIIQAVNEIRTAKGLPALHTNSILMGTAQYTADVMASQMSTSHIGNMKGRIIAAGYGAGYPVTSIWGTENFAVGEGNETAQQIVLGSWADETHMIPMTNTYMCDVGAGVSATGNGYYYYVLHAAYNSDVKCSQSSAILTTMSQAGTATDAAPQWIVPVSRATPNEQGRIYHIVRQGQSLWSIAMAYGTKILVIQGLNNLPTDSQNVYVGQRLLIPTSLTPYATETPAVTETETVNAAMTETPPISKIPTFSPGPPIPTITPTINVAAKAEEDERFRGGLFMALVISMVLIIGGLLVSRKPS